MQQIRERAFFYRRWLSGSIAEYMLVIVCLILATLVLTDFAVFRHNALFTGGIGDATSGFTYLLYADKDWNPAWSHTNLINYPFGESLDSPVYITWFLVLGPLWLLAKLMSAIMAMNVMTIIGFVGSGLVMYWLIKRLTNKWYYAAIAGYGIAFMPFHIVKASDHITHLFNWVAVATIGTFIALWRRPSYCRSLLLALSIAAGFYTDGYYILILATLLCALFVGLLISDIFIFKTTKDIRRRIQFVAISAGMTLLMVVPIIATQINAQKQIGADLANARSNIYADTQFYGSRPIDFVLPPIENPIVKDIPIYKKLLESKSNRSLSESATYLGISVMILCAIGAWYTYKWFRQKRPSSRQSKSIHVIDYTLAVCLIAAPLVVLWMLPPTAHIFGHTIKFPTAYLISVVELWRVPSRLILALQPLIVIGALLALYKVLKRHTERKRLMIAIGVLIVIVLEYMSLIHRPPFSMDMMPKAYEWLKNDKDTRVIAELPLFDRPIEISGYYVFAQMIHNKPIINDSLAKRKPGLMNPLGYDDNKETINFLRERGADTVVIHGQPCAQKEWGDLVYQEGDALMPPFMKQQFGNLCIYRLKQLQVTDHKYAFVDQGFAKITYFDDTTRLSWLTMDSPQVTMFIADSQGRPIKGEKASINMEVGFLGVFKPKTLRWTVYQQDKLLSQGEGFGGGIISAEVDTSREIKIKFEIIDGTHDVLPSIGELGIRQLMVE